MFSGPTSPIYPHFFNIGIDINMICDESYKKYCTIEENAEEYIQSCLDHYLIT